MGKGRLEFVNPLVAWFKTKSIMFIKRKVFFKVSEKKPVDFSFQSVVLHLVGLERIWKSWSWLTSQSKSFQSVDFFENITELVKYIKTVFAYFKFVLALDW